jgi:hypothetical protein
MAKSSKKKTTAESVATHYAPGGPAEGAAMEDFSYGDDEAQDELSPAVSAEDAAHYIAEMVGSLAKMAREAGLDLLNYLLDMAHVEAELQARRDEATDGDA